MPLELAEPDTSIKAAFPGNKGFLILAKLRGMRNVSKEGLKRLRALTVEYCKDKYPEELLKVENGDGEQPMDQTEPETPVADAEATTATEENANKEEKKEDSNDFPESVIKFGPAEMMYENCAFIATNLTDPTDYAHYIFAKMCDDPNWPRPRFPLRMVPIHEMCCLSPKAIEIAVRPLLEKVFAGEEPLRFSIIIHGKLNHDNKDMPRAYIESIVRNIIWSVNPNCIQCIKYQDYALLLEVITPMLFIGLAKDYNQLGRYNTWAIHRGRDMKESMADSEDDISDDPELTEGDNMKKKLNIKKERRLEREEAEKAAAELEGTETEAEKAVEEMNGN